MNWRILLQINGLGMGYFADFYRPAPKTPPEPCPIFVHVHISLCICTNSCASLKWVEFRGCFIVDPLATASRSKEVAPKKSPSETCGDLRRPLKDSSQFGMVRQALRQCAPRQ